MDTERVLKRGFKITVEEYYNQEEGKEVIQVKMKDSNGYTYFLEEIEDAFRNDKLVGTVLGDFIHDIMRKFCRCNLEEITPVEKKSKWVRVENKETKEVELIRKTRGKKPKL